MTTLTVIYTGEPDEVFEFARNRQSRLFGRDDTVCDIVIWSAINGRDLSRIAGRIWRMDDELWVRNLSRRHELTITVPGRPAETPLAPRLDDNDPGPARSIPPGVAFVGGPSGCELLVRQQRGEVPVMLSSLEGEETWHVPPIPARLQRVAAALCEPLLLGGRLPATYHEIDRRAGLASLKRARVLVGDLCRLYASEVPHLQQRIVHRLQQDQEELRLPIEPTLRAGIWQFDRATAPADDPGEVRRRRALALPDYYEVAHLLVRRHLITIDDLRSLEALASDAVRQSEQGEQSGER